MLTWRLVLGVVLGGALVGSGAASTGPVDLHNGGNLHESVGQADEKPMQRGVAYRASTFPMTIHVRPPDALWGGLQLQSGRFRFVQLHHKRKGRFPLAGSGYITIEAAVGRTPSVARTVRNLRSTPLLASGPVRAARVAGFAGQRFDARVVGSDPDNPGISLAPFTTNRHCGFCEVTLRRETRDYKFGGKGQRFRIIVIGVRGKTVVIYIESTFADQPRFPPSRTFPTFLPFAERMLATLRFPAAPAR